MKERNFSHFYLDNNIFWVLCKDSTGKKINNFNNSLLDLGIVSQEKEVHFIGTPFLFLESIGSPHRKINMPKIKIPEELLKESEIENLKSFIYDHAYKFYSEHSSLQPQLLLQDVQNQMKFISEFGSSLFENILIHNTKVINFENSIYQFLSFDFVQKFSYPPSLSSRIAASFSVDILRGCTRNLSQARLISGRWEQISNTLKKNGEISLDEIKKLKDAKYCYKFSSDLVDTEITHFATIGFYDQKKLNPVVCFTCDPSTKVEFRAGLYRTIADQMLTQTQELTLSGKQIPFELLDHANGVICICDEKTGSIVDVIDVQKIEKIQI